MKIELVGGPDCGTVREVAYTNPEVQVNGVMYVRRDRPMTLYDLLGARYGQTGARMYDAKREGGRNGE